MKWYTQKYQDGGEDSESKDMISFTADDRTYIEFLVREYVQNSIDQKLNSEEPIQMVFTLKHINKSKILPYIETLLPHLKAKECNLLPTDFSTRDMITCLAIEELNTTGLTGSTSLNKDTSHYWNFIFGRAKSDKSGSKGGRWGLGKTIYFYNSECRMFWALSTRSDDNQTILVGRAQLNNHWLDEKEQYYLHFSFFGEEGFKPITDFDKIKQFKSVFNITRNNKESGLSLIIPFLRLSIYDETAYLHQIVASLIKHYAYPIIKGDFQCVIRNDNMSTKDIIINSQTIHVVASQIEWNALGDSYWSGVDVNRQLHFLSNVCKTDTAIELDVGQNHYFPKIEEFSFGNDLTEIRSKFINGKLLKFTIPFAIKELGKEKQKTFVTAFIQKDEALKKEFEFYIRSGISVDDIRTLRGNKLYALLLAEDKAVADFLGDAEDPGHRNWKKNTEGFSQKYEHTGIVDAVKRFLPSIVRCLEKSSEDTDYDLLREYFGTIDESEEENEIPKKIPKPEDKGDAPDENVPDPIIPDDLIHTDAWFEQSKIAGGFKVSHKKESTIPENALLIIKSQYIGTKWSPFDFKMDDTSIKIDAELCEIKTKSDNVISIHKLQDKFSIKVTGFHLLRDLKVNVKEEKSLDGE